MSINNQNQYQTQFGENAKLFLEKHPFSLSIIAENENLFFRWVAIRVRTDRWVSLNLTDVTNIDETWKLTFVSSTSTEIVNTTIAKHTGLLKVEITTPNLQIKAIAIDFTAQPDEHYLGFGERFNQVDQRGEEIDLQVINGASGILAYKPVPFFMSSAGYALRLLTSFRTKVRLACYDDPSIVSIRTEANQLSFQLWTGKPFADLLSRYTRLLGKPLYRPPAWVFGPWKSRDWTAETQSTVEEDLRLQRQLNLPGTVKLIDAAWESQLNDFQFNQNFPDPQGMITEARKLGYRLILWISPWMVKNDPVDPIYEFCADNGYLIKDQYGNPYIHRLGNSPGFVGSCFDFTNPDAIIWWQDQIERLVKMGIDGFKTDFGEQVPEDALFYNGKTGQEMRNLFPKIYNQVTYEAMQRHTQGVLLARSAWDGSQPYCAIWAGDQSADFGPATGLPSVMIAGQTAGLSGFPFWASDIGGYFGQPTEEIFIRWIEFGAFSPIMQLHGLGCREPWKFSQKVLDTYRHFARVHMDLFPYLYTCAQEASQTGMPVMRAMPLAFPDDPAIWQENAEFQYCFGKDLLVAPVYFGHATKRHVYLPPGLWRDFWNGATFQGGQEVIVNAELDQIPVFARAGAIIPLLDPSADTLLPVLDEPEIKVAGNDLRLCIYPGANGNFQLHDGTQFAWQENEQTLEVHSQPVNRSVSVRIMGEALRSVLVKDEKGNDLPIHDTNLNGDPDHFRFTTEPGHAYSISFSRKE